jgi:hypothetical protein
MTLFSLENPIPAIFGLFKFSYTTSARLKGLLFFGLFLLAIRHFSLDHFDKINYQMQDTLIEANTVKYEDQFQIVIGSASDHEDEDLYESLNDENFY